MPHFIKPSKQDEDRDCDSIPMLSSRHFTFQSHLTSLYMIPTKYKFVIREFKNDYHASIASKLITPYDCWLNNKVKIFSLQYNFLRPSPYDLRTEENDANFLPYQIKKAHQIKLHTKNSSSKKKLRTISSSTPNEPHLSLLTQII